MSYNSQAKEQHLKLFTQADWCLSRQGSAIALTASDPLPTIVRPTLLIGGVHGDEPEGVVMASECLNWLKHDAQKPQVTAPWIVIPNINPDGAALNERTNGAGIDLNRNYPSRNWSPQATKARYNPGTSPGTEPEVRALVALIKQTKPCLIIHCHAWNPCIVVTGAPGLAAGQALAAASGYKVVDEIGYPTPGSLSDYGWHDHHIPVICVEEQEHVDLATVWPRFATGFQQIFLQNLGASR